MCAVHRNVHAGYRHCRTACRPPGYLPGRAGATSALVSPRTGTVHLPGSRGEIPRLAHAFQRSWSFYCSLQGEKPGIGHGAFVFRARQKRVNGPLFILSLSPAQRDRSWGIFPGRIHRMLQRGHHHKRVHGRVQLHVTARLRIAAVEGELTAVIDGDFAEEVDHHQQIFEIEIPLTHLHQQVVRSVSVKPVTQFLIASLAILFSHLGGVQYAAKRVMPAAGICGDACQHASHVGVKAVSGGQSRGVLAFQGVGQVQTFTFLVRIQHQQADVCSTFNVGHTQDLPALKHKREVTAAGQDLFT
ncbi:hypothetical protein EcWSU1_02000 [Enterobacter ludwigii]|uniref:Uncharacterized protein n=1 Tax=Enterobacter ludwigii TaxID=299767 RepID=G8LN19_9ENTR|nr:hypothetical protein EcWSU1_02000 [Enterobacter ludwigii]